MIIKHAKTPSSFQGLGAKSLRANFRRIERREWLLWVAAAIITLLLTIALASFLLPNSSSPRDFHALYILPQAVRGLVALVFLFDLYTIYQHLQIYRIRRQLIEREELFHLISENAADMIAVVDLEGRRIFNSISYQKIVGYSPEELQESSGFEQIHPEDRERVKKAATQTQQSGMGTILEYRFRHKNGNWMVLESVAGVIRNEKGEPEKLVIVNRDITERKKAQEALSRSEASFRSLVEGDHSHLRAVLYHQGSGRGHGPRSRDRVWRGEAKQRIYLGGQRAGQSIHFSDLPSNTLGHRTSFRC